MTLRDYLLETFIYDPETGIFTNRVRRSQCHMPGQVAGSISKKDGYVRIVLRGRVELGHRIAWLYVYGATPPKQIDHINGVRSDNRIANLRLASANENSMNKLIAKNNTSGFKGVSYAKRHRKWTARIQLNRKHHFLGFFNSPEAAHAAYCSAAKVLYGAFANDGDGCPQTLSDEPPPEPALAG